MADDLREEAVRRLRETKGLAKLVGEASAFLAAIAQVPAMARSDATVLIEGETGTGKELVARAIHYLSPRASFPFVSVNCGSLLDTLLEDELFGHERGAFTDAQHRRPGLVTQADKGTLFLDEVDALSPRAQIVLLRLLQDRTFRTLGSSREQTSDVRFVTATNTSLIRLVQADKFRRDLYYRVCVFSISLPTLRERREDILRLAGHFIRKHALPNTPPPELSPPARATLLAFDWPGNVRELENAIIRGIQLCRTGSISVGDLGLPSLGLAPPSLVPSVLPSGRSLKSMKRQMIESLEREFLVRLLAEHCGNVSRAARAAGTERRNFGKMLKKYHLDPKLFATPPEAPYALGGANPAHTLGEVLPTS